MSSIRFDWFLSITLINLFFLYFLLICLVTILFTYTLVLYYLYNHLLIQIVIHFQSSISANSVQQNFSFLAYRKVSYDLLEKSPTASSLLGDKYNNQCPTATGFQSLKISFRKFVILFQFFGFGFSYKSAIICLKLPQEALGRRAHSDTSMWLNFLNSKPIQTGVYDVLESNLWVNVIIKAGPQSREKKGKIFMDGSMCNSL